MVIYQKILYKVLLRYRDARKRTDKWKSHGSKGAVSRQVHKQWKQFLIKLNFEGLIAKYYLTDRTASIFNIRGVFGMTKGDSHCSNNSKRNCKQDRISSSWKRFLGSSSFISMMRASASSLSESSWTSDETRRVLIALEEICRKNLISNL